MKLQIGVKKYVIRLRFHDFTISSISIIYACNIEFQIC